MRTTLFLFALLALSLVLISSSSGDSRGYREASVLEWQLTSTPITHILDNNDNFSLDNRFLSFDTRDTLGNGLTNCTSIGKVDIATGVETILYAPPFTLSTSPTGAAPGMGAASFSPLADEVVFIHGPFVSDVPTLGPYVTTNRHGGVVPGDGSGKVHFLDLRDVTNDPTTPGAMRGGTHRHEFTLDGKRVGFTYDDYFMTPAGYGRTCGFMVPHPKAPTGFTHYAVLLVPIVPAATAKPGDLVRAENDSWVGAKGLMRAFIGTVKENDGSTTTSLFVVDVPADVDVTTADSGTKTRLPGPPKGTTIRRLTHTVAGGIVRGSQDGTRIGYLAAAADGTQQVFVIPSNGSDTDPDPTRRPVQATFLPKGVVSGLRWHPSSNSIAVLSDNGVAVICVKPGPLFGVSYFLTPHGDQYASTSIEGLVWSRDGSRLAYNRRMPTYDAGGKLTTDFNGGNWRQIFLTNFPDRNGNGIADPIDGGAIINAASFVPGPVAPNSWASFFGSNLAPERVTANWPALPTMLAGISVDVIDSTGAQRPALLQLVSPQQITFLVPPDTNVGDATVVATLPDLHAAVAPTQITAVAPGLFSANANGWGVAAAIALRIDARGNQTSQPVFQCTGGPGTCAATPIDLGSETDQVFLQLFGTGIFGYTSKVTANIGGQTANVMGAAAQAQFAGLDQINLRMPHSLAGKGEVPVQITVDGKTANIVSVNIK